MPIGITYIRTLRAQDGITRADWVKSAALLGGFLLLGVATPNVALADKDSPYSFTDHQLGPYDPDIPEGSATLTESEEQG